MSEHEDKNSARRLQLEDYELVAETIIKLCAAKDLRRADVPATWACTQDIAEDGDSSIDKTRYLLLKMAKKSWVQVTPQPINNALRWYICPDIKTDG